MKLPDGLVERAAKAIQADLRVAYRCDGCGWHDEGKGGDHSRPATFADLVEAALSEGGKIVNWCERHQARWGYVEVCGFQRDESLCPKSQRLVTPLERTKE